MRGADGKAGQGQAEIVERGWKRQVDANVYRFTLHDGSLANYIATAWGGSGGRQWGELKRGQTNGVSGVHLLFTPGSCTRPP